MKSICVTLAVMVSLLFSFACPALAEEPVYPDYVLKAQTLVERASSQASELNSFTDEVLIARNFIRNAEAEYKKNLGWTGKFDTKAEPTVRYFAAMAQAQAEIVISRAGKIAQEKAQAAYESQIASVTNSIKVFDDKNAEITALKSSLSTAEQKVAELSKGLETSKAENSKLREEFVALSAAKGAEVSQNQEQIKALSRQKDFIAEVGKLGGMIKTGSDNMTVVYSRSAMFKKPRYDKLTADGSQMVERVAGLLKKYPEYRARIKVHGFGSPVKYEDATGTDRMARLIRSALADKAKMDLVSIEAVGAGATEPVYPKSNVEGNRRVEITFIKK